MRSARILIVDDDPVSAAMVSDVLDGTGWVKYVAGDGEEALTTISREKPDLVILDLVLPKIDGFEVCRRIRESFEIPILVLSGKVSPEDKIKCLRLGADDYVTKPFHTGELYERVQAILRRAKHTGLVPDETASFADNGLTIDFGNREVILGNNKVVLTVTEFNLLRELVLNAGKVLTHVHLLERVWGHAVITEREYIHVYMGHLRSKIGPYPDGSERLVNVRGVGYMFRRQGS